MSGEYKPMSGTRRLRGGGGIFKSAAVAVLRLEHRLMTTGEITRVALEQSLIKCQGRTPEATMASALYTDVKRKHDKSVFTRPQEGLFGLREWEEEGFEPYEAPIDEDALPFTSRPASGHLASTSGIENMMPANESMAKFGIDNVQDTGASRDTSPCRASAPTALCESPIRLLQPEHHAQMPPLESSLQYQQSQPQMHSTKNTLSSQAASLKSIPHEAVQDRSSAMADSKRSFNTAWSAPSLIDPGWLQSLPQRGPDHPHSQDATSRADTFEALLDSEPSSLNTTPRNLAFADSMLTHASVNWGHMPHISPRSNVGSVSTGKRIRSRSASPPKMPKLANIDHSTLMPWTPGPYPRSPVTPINELLQEPCPLTSPCMQWLHMPRASLRRGHSVTGDASERQDLPSPRPHRSGSSAERDMLLALTTQQPSSCKTPSAISPRSATLEPLQMLQPSVSAGICCAEEEVVALERRLGTAHPRVGKAWLQLSRAYQAAGGPACAHKAEQALLRAWRICSHSFYVYNSHQSQQGLPQLPHGSLLDQHRLQPHTAAGAGESIMSMQHMQAAQQSRQEPISGFISRVSSPTSDFLL